MKQVKRSFSCKYSFENVVGEALTAARYNNNVILGKVINTIGKNIRNIRIKNQKKLFSCLNRTSIQNKNFTGRTLSITRRKLR